MEITFLGHSSFRIRSHGVYLLTDPFDPKMVGLKYPAVQADVVTVSHQHEDHNYVSAVRGARKIISAVGEYEVGGISIIGIKTCHDKKNGQERGFNVIYLIEAEGIRLAHLGDLGHQLSDEVVEEMGEVDILILPVGGVASLDPKEAAEVVRSIEPKIVIPMHYQEPGLNQAVFAKLRPVEEFLREVALPVERMEKLAIKQIELGEEARVVVLDAR